MAGRRRTRDITVAPALRRTRKDRRRERLTERWAAATSPVQRLEVAHDYVRGAAARRQPDPVRVRQLLDDLARHVVAVGDQLLEMQTRERLATPRETAA